MVVRVTGATKRRQRVRRPRFRPRNTSISCRVEAQQSAEDNTCVAAIGQARRATGVDGRGMQRGISQEPGRVLIVSSGITRREGSPRSSLDSDGSGLLVAVAKEQAGRSEVNHGRRTGARDHGR